MLDDLNFRAHVYYMNSIFPATDMKITDYYISVALIIAYFGAQLGIGFMLDLYYWLQNGQFFTIVFFMRFILEIMYLLIEKYE